VEVDSTNLEVPSDGSTLQPLETPNIQESIPNAKCGPLMLPPLPNEMVIHHIWPQLCENIILTLLCHLKHVNKNISHHISASFKWSTLVFVQHDLASYKEYINHHGIPRDNLATRLRFEIRCFKYIVSKNLTQFRGRQTPHKFNCLSYVVMDSCPPNLESYPNYYEI
jgi:hypothetical protein